MEHLKQSMNKYPGSRIHHFCVADLRSKQPSGALSALDLKLTYQESPEVPE
jgi:hypothetical protein